MAAGFFGAVAADAGPAPAPAGFVGAVSKLLIAGKMDYRIHFARFFTTSIYDFFLPTSAVRNSHTPIRLATTEMVSEHGTAAAAVYARKNHVPCLSFPPGDGWRCSGRRRGCRGGCRSGLWGSGRLGRRSHRRRRSHHSSARLGRVVPSRRRRLCQRKSCPSYSGTRPAYLLLLTRHHVVVVCFTWQDKNLTEVNTTTTTRETRLQPL